jgi:hypothetical protein
MWGLLYALIHIRATVDTSGSFHFILRVESMQFDPRIRRGELPVNRLEPIIPV